MRADQYSVQFGYRATDGTYYFQPTAGKPKTSLWTWNYHRGNDRPCPVGTPLYIGGVLAGWTGRSGRVSGPHLHSGAFRGSSDIDPGPFEFKPGVVVVVGEDSVNGKYIKVDVGGGVIVNYLHLLTINVSTGQRLQGGSMGYNPNEGDVRNILGELWGRAPNPEDYGYTKQNWHDFVYNILAAYPWQNRKQDFNRALALAEQNRINAETAGSIAGIRGDALNNIAAALGIAQNPDATVLANQIVARIADLQRSAGAADLIAKERAEEVETGNRFLRWIGQILSRN